jgi:hypothetical protein
VPLCAYGRTVGLAGPEHVLQLAREWLPPAYRPSEGPAERCWAVRRRADDDWPVLVDGIELSTHNDPTAATEALLSDLELWIAERALGAVFVHAGCVVAGGRAVVVPGYSMSGKTSLTAALVRAGADCYSDEFAVLDRRGFVRPYPRPLAMRAGVGPATQRVPAAELGRKVGRGPAQVSLIAALRYDAATGWDVTPVTRIQAALCLLEHTVPAQSRPRASLDALERATAGALAVAGTRGDADHAAALLLDMLLS